MLCNASKAKGRWPVVAVEPWCDAKITRNPANLLSDTTSGKYDAAIRAISADLKAYSGPVLVRWAHEMEMTNNFGRYPWATADYNSYKAAYIHVNNLFKLYTFPMKQVLYVWSPGGSANSNSYYPGDAYCDYVACSLYSWGAYDNKYGYDGSFANFFGPKYNLLKTHAKPVMFSRMAACLSTVKPWLSITLFGGISRFGPVLPGNAVRCVRYFGSWPFGYSHNPISTPVGISRLPRECGRPRKSSTRAAEACPCWE